MNPKHFVDVTQRKLKPIPGAAPLSIAASEVVWMKKNEETGRYSVHYVDALKLNSRGIVLSPTMMADHMPFQYEVAFEALREKKN